jgi:hypothetical protein
VLASVNVVHCRSVAPEQVVGDAPNDAPLSLLTAVVKSVSARPT